MDSKTTLSMGVDTFTEIDLIRKAAEYKGLELKGGSSKAYSKPIKEYKLDNKMLVFLAERKIKRQDRPDCRNEIFTLIDENPQQRIPGWSPSNYWNFSLPESGERRFDLRIILSVNFVISIEKRGVVLLPNAHGTYVSPADLLPHFRMFKALTDGDKNAPAVAKELAASEGNIVVTWTELGFGGIRTLANIFLEFTGTNEKVRKLSEQQDVFDPKPNNDMFVIEPVQPRIIQCWRDQLANYRARLVV